MAVDCAFTLISAIPQALSRDGAVKSVLRNPRWVQNDSELIQRRSLWSRDPELRELSKELEENANDVNLLSALYVIDAVGDTIAANNYKTAENLIGTLYAG